jgi:AcrR family transcriptional regulator
VLSTDGTIESPPLGRRERKKLQTRERLVECAVGLFASQGYDATTIEDIGECADVSRATVFNYFPRKEDIVSEVFARRRAEIAVLVAEANEQISDTQGRLRHVLRGRARLYENDPAIGRASVRAWLRAGGPLMPDASDTAALFADLIRTGQDQGDIPTDLDATRAGLVILDTYLGVLYRWVADDDYAFEKNLIAALDLILTGISPNPGRGGR